MATGDGGSAVHVEKRRGARAAALYAGSAECSRCVLQLSEALTVREVTLRAGSDEAEIAYILGCVPRGYRVNRVTGEVTVTVPEEALVGMFETERGMAA